MSNNNSVNSQNSSNKKSTLWDNVGNVNINLDNLSLSGQNQKKQGLPMNAMVTPTNSPQKMMHPAGSSMAGPPPLRAVQPNNPGSAASGFDSLNDLLN